jgi:hypothetical protein
VGLTTCLRPLLLLIIVRKASFPSSASEKKYRANFLKAVDSLRLLDIAGIPVVPALAGAAFA